LEFLLAEEFIPLGGGTCEAVERDVGFGGVFNGGGLLEVVTGFGWGFLGKIRL
jgi:hypothetical protein